MIRARPGLALIFAALAALLWCGLAQAHQINLTNARIVVNADRTVDVDVAMRGSDVDRVLGTKIFDEHAVRVRPDALAAVAARVAAYMQTHAVVMGDGGAECRPGTPAVAPDGDGVVVRSRWSCADVPGKLRYRSTVLVDVAPDARQVVLIGSGEQQAQDLLDASRSEVTLTDVAPPSLVQVIGRYIVAGIEHILTGYDHMCFLIAIVLWARNFWPVVKIVTAFTVAHSITLSLAALNIVRIPDSIIEPAIAATIIYVAVENFVSRDVRQRWRDTFLFGLIHGFGFASALQEFGLPRGALVPALASFNIGVEIGQIAIVSLVLPLLFGLDRVFAWRARPPAPPVRAAAVVYTLSGLIAAFGSYWFLGRTVLDLPMFGS